MLRFTSFMQMFTVPNMEPNATANNVMVTKSVMLHSTESLAPDLVRKRETLDYKAAGEIFIDTSF